jgi:hypothetical protein
MATTIQNIENVDFAQLLYPTPEPNYPFPISVLRPCQHAVLLPQLASPYWNGIPDLARRDIIERRRVELQERWVQMEDAAIRILWRRWQCPLCFERPRRPLGPSRKHKPLRKWLDFKPLKNTLRMATQHLEALQQIDLDRVSRLSGLIEDHTRRNMR